MPSKLTTGQIDEASFTQFFHEKTSGTATSTSGFYAYSNPLNFLQTDSFVVDSGNIMSRVSGLSSNVSGALNTSGQFLFEKDADVSGYAETFTISTSGFLQNNIETVSGDFSSTSGEFLKSGSFYHTGSGDFSLNASSGALAFSSGHNDSFGLFVVTGDTSAKEGWMRIAGEPEVTGFISTASGDLKTSLNTTGANLNTSISNILTDSSTNFSAKKTFAGGIKTSQIDLSGDGVTLRVNANNSLSFDDVSGSLLSLSAGYGSDAPVFSVTDKAGLPLIDVYDDDRINFGPYGTNPLNISGQKVSFGNYKSYFSGTNVHLSGDVTINDLMTVSGISGGLMILDGLPAHPHTGGLPDGTLFTSGGTAGIGRHLMII
jgi:hypothetical protein